MASWAKLSTARGRSHAGWWGGHAALVGADFASFTGLDRQQRRVLGYSASGDDGEDADELFRRIVDQHPLCLHQLETGEVAAVPARTTTLTYASTRRRTSV